MGSLLRTEALREWEEARGFLDSLKAAALLCAAILFKPVVFFDTLASAGGDTQRRLIRALVFALALGYLKLLFDLLYSSRLGALSPTMLAPGVKVPLDAGFSLSSASPFVFLRPIVSFVVTLGVVCAGIKFALGWGRVLFPALLVVCYKSAADIFYALPFVGGILAAVWGLSLLMIGVRALYRVDLFRAAVAAVLMPVVMLFFFALSMGASFNKMIVRLYPETQPQVTRFNDMSAFLYTSSVASAARQYKNELGFYPAHMGLLKKYLPSSASEELGRTDAANGYRYRYERLGEDRFVVASSPIQKDVSGHFVFFADETGQVRLGNQTGPVVKDIEALDQWTSSSR
jgi:hypothetical protein